MTFGMHRGPRFLWGVGLTLFLAGCADPPSSRLVAGGDNRQCIVKAEVTLARLDDGTAPVVDPARLLSLYPDRAQRMMVEGVATYACRREAERTLCVSEGAEPLGVSFEHLDQRLADLLTPANGQTLRLRLTFKILEKGECRFQVALPPQARG